MTALMYITCFADSSFAIRAYSETIMPYDALPDMKRELKFYPAKKRAKKLNAAQIQQFTKGILSRDDLHQKKISRSQPRVL